MLRSLVHDLQQYTIRATDGDIGRVDRFLFDDQQWTVRYLVVDTGQWLPGRRVLIAPRAVSGVDTKDRTIALDLTKAKIHDSPDLDADKPVSRQQEADLHSYYGYPSYWGQVGGPGSWAAWAHPPGAVAPAVPYAESPEQAAGTSGSDQTARDASEGDPHLRSTREVAGYHIEATDGAIGHVKDFVADDGTWTIHYLVIDTSNWIGGRNVLLSRDWVSRVEWATSKVHVDVTREQVKNSPEYDPSQLLNREHEQALHRHYHREGYWTGDER